MKIKIIGLAVIWGGFWGMSAFWCVFLRLLGIGTVTYDLVDQLCLGLLSPNLFGAVLGSVFGFCMGAGTAVIGGVIYNGIVEMFE
jgi:hypothetical protein